MQVNKLLVSYRPIRGSVGMVALHTVVQLVFDLDSEVVCHMLCHSRFAMRELTFFSREYIVLFGDNARSRI